MSDVVLGALISGAVTLVVCMINNTSQQGKTRALLEYRLTELTKRVDKHNNLVERMYRVEETTTLHEEKIKVVNHRLADLERSEEHESEH